MTKQMHVDEITINTALVKELLEAQFPQWASLPLTPVHSMGTDNALYKLGSEMSIRLPRLPAAAQHAHIEHDWLPTFALTSPLAIPILIAQGVPQANYPWHWSIYKWLEGENAYDHPIIDKRRAALDLAHFITALQKIDSTGGPVSRRGVPLKMRNKEVRSAIEALRNDIDTQVVTKEWEQALQAPAWNKSPVWLHGDLLPANLLVQNGCLTGVIDFDSLGVGDPACDLLPAWSVFDGESREVFRSSLGVDDATWQRGRGWALSIALIIIPYYKNSNPRLVAVAQRMLRELLA